MSRELPPDPRSPARGPGGQELVPSGSPGGFAAAEPAHLYGTLVEDDAHFWDYWQVLLRHRWTVISTFLATVIVTVLWTFSIKPVYTGTVTLRIEKEEPRVLKFEEVLKAADSQLDYYQTQYKILQSRSLANRVIGLLQLDRHPDFQQADDGGSLMERGHAWLRLQLIRFIPLPPPPAVDGAEDLAPESPLTASYLRRLTVEPIRNSRLVKLSFDSHYPDLAARIPNTAAEAFIAQQLDEKVEATRYATQFLAKQLDEARDKLGEAETRLNRFLDVNDILFLTTDRNGQPQDLVSQQLALVSDAFLKARADRVAKESLVAQASTADTNTLPSVLQSSLIERLKQELVNEQSEYEKLSQVFKPGYPRMQQLSQKIAESRRQLRAEIARAVESLQTDYRAAVRTEREMEAALVRHRSLARRLSNRMAEYNLLRRDTDTSRDLYSALLARLRETQISSALLTSNIYVVDRAEIPSHPSRPLRSLNLLLACVGGLVGGIGLAFFFEYLDTNIKDAREVENVLRVPILGLIPSRAAFDRRRIREQRALAAGDAQPEPFALVSHLEMSSVFAEAFRNLRTSLLYSTPDHPPKTIMMTSLQPEDGKTTLVTNLAITLAQLGAGEVVLVDGDMRRPNLHLVLGVRQAPGLSAFLTGQAELEDVLVPTAIPGLSVIPSGRIPLKPSELLASTRLRQGIDALGQRFSHVVFDTGPLLGLSDALILAAQVEGVMLVLRHGRASRTAAHRAVRNLVSVRARLLGVVLNDMNVREIGYYGSYGYHARYYGHEARKEPA
jgi:capsular exopolysaccharide synthesis family protein